MRVITAAVTERGQVTIPAEVRRALGLKPRDRVMFTIDEDEVRLAPVRYTLETAFGSVKPVDPSAVFDDKFRAVKEEIAERAVRKMRQSE